MAHLNWMWSYQALASTHRDVSDMLHTEMLRVTEHIWGLSTCSLASGIYCQLIRIYKMQMKSAWKEISKISKFATFVKVPNDVFWIMSGAFYSWQLTCEGTEKR